MNPDLAEGFFFKNDERAELLVSIAVEVHYPVSPGCFRQNPVRLSAWFFPGSFFQGVLRLQFRLPVTVNRRRPYFIQLSGISDLDEQPVRAILELRYPDVQNTVFRAEREYGHFHLAVFYGVNFFRDFPVQQCFAVLADCGEEIDGTPASGSIGVPPIFDAESEIPPFLLNRLVVIGIGNGVVIDFSVAKVDGMAGNKDGSSLAVKFLFFLFNGGGGVQQCGAQSGQQGHGEFLHDYFTSISCWVFKPVAASSMVMRYAPGRSLKAKSSGYSVLP